MIYTKPKILALQFYAMHDKTILDFCIAVPVTYDIIRANAVEFQDPTIHNIQIPIARGPDVRLQVLRKFKYQYTRTAHDVLANDIITSVVKVKWK